MTPELLEDLRQAHQCLSRAARKTTGNECGLLRDIRNEMYRIEDIIYSAIPVDRSEAALMGPVKQ